MADKEVTMLSAAMDGYTNAQLREVMGEATIQIIQLNEKLNELRATKDGAYRERNLVVALAARLIVSMGLDEGQHDAWRGRHEAGDDASWAEWLNVVFLRLPNGDQLSWHIHDSEFHLFEWLPLWPAERPGGYGWDGHTTEEKYERLRRFVLGEAHNG